MTRLFQATWIVPTILALAGICQAGMDTGYEWKYIDYVWESDEAKAAAVEAGTYDKTKIIINDVQPLTDGRILITTAKYYDNPASLSTISEESGDGGYLLSPYPDWSWHTDDADVQIISVARVILDDYGRLWLVDSGKIGDEQVASPKLLVFDETTDELLLNVEIPAELSYNPDDETKGRLELSAVETSGDLTTDTWAYMSDIDGHGFLIWNTSNVWRLDHDVYKANSDYETFTIVDESVDLSIGPSSVLILPEGYLEKRTMMFKPMTSILGHAVTLEDLHESWDSDFEPTYWTTDFVAPSQELERTMTKDGILLAGFSTPAFLACWNLENPLEEAYIAFLEFNDDIFQFVSGVKDLDGTLYVASNRLQKFILGTMDFDEVNFRLLVADIDTLVSGTVCEPTDTWTTAESIEDKSFSLFDGTS